MKKLVLLLAVAFSVALFSCNKAAEATEEAPVAEETTEVVAEEVAPCEECEGECEEAAAAEEAPAEEAAPAEAAE